MASEIFGDLIIAAIELGVEVGTDGNKKNGWGCLVIAVLIIGGLVAYYYFG